MDSMRARTYLLLFLFLALRAFGNLSLTFGVRRLPQTLSTHPLAIVTSVLDPWVVTGIAMMILALLARLALLSLADLSFVLPMTAVGYVIAAALGRFFLHEEVTPLRWVAIFLIFAGAALVGSTSQKSA